MTITDGKPEGYTTLTPFLVCSPATEAIRFYEEVFGATLVSRMDGPGGTVMHAELDLGDGRLQLSDPNEQFGLIVPDRSGDSVSGSICIYVPDVGRRLRQGGRARRHGAEKPDTFVTGDRFASIYDPFGHRWAVMTKVEDVSPEEAERRLAEWGATPSRAERQPGEQDLHQRADRDRVQDGAEAQRAAEQPAAGDDGHLDRGADQPHRPARATDQAGHQPVPRSRPEVHADVGGGGDGVQQDAEREQPDLHRPGRRRRDDGERGVDGQPDDDDVAHRAEPGRWRSGIQPSSTSAPTRMDDRADRPSHAVGEPLVQHVPRHVAQRRADDQRHRDAVEGQTCVELDQPMGQAAAGGEGTGLRREHPTSMASHDWPEEPQANRKVVAWRRPRPGGWPTSSATSTATARPATPPSPSGCGCSWPTAGCRSAPSSGRARSRRRADAQPGHGDRRLRPAPGGRLGHRSARSGTFAALPAGPHRGAWCPAPVDDGTIDMAHAAPSAPSSVPAAFAAALAELHRHLPQHGYHPAGLPDLRARIAERYTARGLPTTPEQVLVTAGALHGVGTAFQTLLRRGQRLLVEHPTYPNALDAARAVGLRILPTALDPDEPDEWLAAA